MCCYGGRGGCCWSHDVRRAEPGAQCLVGLLAPVSAPAAGPLAFRAPGIQSVQAVAVCLWQEKTVGR